MDKQTSDKIKDNNKNCIIYDLEKNLREKDGKMWLNIKI